jgi:hypothetical protein
MAVIGVIGIQLDSSWLARVFWPVANDLEINLEIGAGEMGGVVIMAG